MFPSTPLLAAVAGPFKRAQQGLFQGKMKQFGNNVPNSKHKTRRTWLPNIHNKRLFSDALQQMIRIKLTARALKTVKKVRPRLPLACGAEQLVNAVATLQHGGLDNYLLKTKPDLLGWEGMRLRVMVREKQQQQAAAAGEVASSVVSMS